MTTADTASTFARCRALALGEMIAQGGSAAWVAVSSVSAETPATAAKAASRVEFATAAAPLSAADTRRVAALPEPVRLALGRVLERIAAGPSTAARESLAAAAGCPRRATLPR
jgi:hypothetical protein